MSDVTNLTDTASGLHRPLVGLEQLTLAKESLEDFIAAAAGAGAKSVCLSTRNPRLLDDPGVRRETCVRLDDVGISVAMGDGFLLQPAIGLDGLLRQLDLIVDLGVALANTCAFEPDESSLRGPSYVQDLLGRFCAEARSAGVGVLVEFTPLSHVPSLAAAVQLLEDLDQPNLAILLDTLHLARAGEGPSELAEVDPRLIGYCQVSDGRTGTRDHADYLDEAVYERMIPGEGDLPLVEVLTLLRRDVTVSAEVPMRSLRQAGVSPAEQASRIIEPSRDLLARAWSR